jgi:beta-xylosidase
MNRTIIIACFLLFAFNYLTAALPEDGSKRAEQEMTKFGPLNQVCSGVNIHFVRGHEADMDLMVKAGINYIRTDLVWQTIETKKGHYDWSAYDELTLNLTKRGIRILYILDYSNSLYEQSVDFKDPITGEIQTDVASPRHPESIQAFARWAAAAADHFRSYNVVWEIWNEPNVTFWRPVPDITEYITLAIATCKAVKAIVPDAIIIGPATSQIPVPFIESFMASGVLQYLDAVSVHPYRSYDKSPETAADEYRQLRELIGRYAPDGKKNMPVISSEWGYASAREGISTGKQAAFIVRMQLANLLNGVPVSIWYDWKNDGDSPTNFEHNCGTVTSDLKPKPAFSALRTMNNELKGFTFLRRLDVGNNNDYVLLFKNENNRFKIAAWTMDPQHHVVVGNNIPDLTRVRSTDGYGNNKELKTEQGKLIPLLDELPQYIILPVDIKELSF